MYNGDVGGVSGGNNVQWNKKLAEQLDAADGKKDGKITASVWNGFINHTGSNGNKIKWNISVDNAAKSFRYYDTKKDTGKVDWNNWADMYAEFTGKPSGNEGAAPAEGAATPEKPAEEQMQDAGINVGADEERLEHAAQTTLQDTGGSLQQAPVQHDKRQKVEITDDYKDNGDGTKTKTQMGDDGKPGFTQTIDSEGHVISESEFRHGINTGKEIEIRRNYFADGSIEKVAFVDGERFDDFDDGEMSKPGELQFRFVKDSPMKIVDSKMPAEADLLKAGFKKDDSVMTMNGGAIYYNEQTGESFVLDEFSKTCEYRKGNITQKHSYDSDGNLTYGTIEVKGENGAFETYTYQQNEDYKELTVTSENSHDAPTTPEAFAADSLNGHWRNIDAFRDELNLPDGFDGLTFDIKEGTQEKLSEDGTCKIKVTVNPDGNMSVEYSQKQADGSFKELGKYQLTKYDSPGSLRGYDFMFEAFNNLTGNKRTISGGDWSGDY